jgi:cyclic dehypoxanthinyl futalosine synthase
MRISFEDGLKLFIEAPLEELQKRAQSVSRHRNSPLVTFVKDTNPNYTNICSSACSFCAFWRPRAHKEAYFKTLQEVKEDLERAEKCGATTVLLQGGLHEGVTLEYLASLVRLAKDSFPSLHPHFFSAPEIAWAASLSKVPLQEALQTLFDAGLRTIPGGGAEILSQRVRKKISPKKISTQEWLEVHGVAHKIGFKTTATMMYGHIEEPEDILIHFDGLRKLQDETGGFSSFIPWSFKRANSPLGKKVEKEAPKELYLRLIAFSRLYLDNFPHIGASWFGEGKETGQKALHYGADDWGGILIEENVHKACNFINRTTVDEVVSIIRGEGFIPAERNCMYEIIKVY